MEAMKRPTPGEAAMASKSASFRKRNPELFPVTTSATYSAGTVIGPSKPAKRVRQPKDRRSQLEKDFGVWLQFEFRDDKIYPQFPFSEGTGVNYYLDFLRVFAVPSYHYSAFQFTGYEVKDLNQPPSRTAKGIAKLKIAARMYPWITFYLVTRDGKAGDWQQQEILP